MVTSVLIEMTAEPLFIYAQIKSQFTVRIIAETSCLMMRCLFLLSYFLMMHPVDHNDGDGDDGEDGRKSGSKILLAFSVGQVVGSVSYSLIFWMHFCRQPDFHVSSFTPTLPIVRQLLISVLLIVTPLIL